MPNRKNSDYGGGFLDTTSQTLLDAHNNFTIISNSQSNKRGKSQRFQTVNNKKTSARSSSNIALTQQDIVNQPKKRLVERSNATMPIYKAHQSSGQFSRAGTATSKHRLQSAYSGTKNQSNKDWMTATTVGLTRNLSSTADDLINVSAAGWQTQSYGREKEPQHSQTQSILSKLQQMNNQQDAMVHNGKWNMNPSQLSLMSITQDQRQQDHQNQNMLTKGTIEIKKELTQKKFKVQQKQQTLNNHLEELNQKKFSTASSSNFMKNKLLSKENKIKELQRLIGNRKNVFGAILKEKEELYNDTMMFSQSNIQQNNQDTDRQLENQKSGFNLRSSATSIQDFMKMKQKIGSCKDIHVNSSNLSNDEQSQSYGIGVAKSTTAAGQRSNLRPISHINSQKVINTTQTTGITPDHMKRKVFGSGNINISIQKTDQEHNRKIQMGDVQFLIPESPNREAGTSDK